MIKKFLKGVIMGLLYELIDIAKFFVPLVWLPMLVTLILKIFKINVSDENMLFIIFTAAFCGTMISGFICHCKDAIDYQEENQCDFHEAWGATCCYEEEEF